MATNKLPALIFMGRVLARVRSLAGNPPPSFTEIGGRAAIAKKIADGLPPSFLHGGHLLYAGLHKVSTTVRYDGQEAFLHHAVNIATENLKKSDILAILEGISATPTIFLPYTYSFQIIDRTAPPDMSEIPYEPENEALDIRFSLYIRETKSGQPYISILCSTKSSKVDEDAFPLVAKLTNDIASKIYQEITRARSMGPGNQPPPIFS